MLLALYGIVAAANVIAAGTGEHWLDWATKPLLMPLLALWVWRTGGRHEAALLTALALSWAGDLALQFEGQLFFIAGMVLFAGAHLRYLTMFAKGGARPKPLVAGAYAIVLVCGLIWLWKPLGDMALPMMVYAVLLTAMATLAASVNRVVGVGGMLFLISDFLIAIGVAEAWTVPGPPIWVMLTYTAAQFLIVTGWVKRGRSLLGSTT